MKQNKVKGKRCAAQKESFFKSGIWRLLNPPFSKNGKREGRKKKILTFLFPAGQFTLMRSFMQVSHFVFFFFLTFFFTGSSQARFFEIIQFIVLSSVTTKSNYDFRSSFILKIFFSTSILEIFQNTISCKRAFQIRGNLICPIYLFASSYGRN